MIDPTTFLGIVASLIFVWASQEQIWKIQATKNAEDFSRLTCFLWTIGLAMFFWMSLLTNAHIIFKCIYGLQTLQYAWLTALVIKMQKRYQMPLNRKHLQVYRGGRFSLEEWKKKKK